MPKYHYVIFGGGGMGMPIVHDVRRNCEAADVTLIEPDAARRKQTAAYLQKLRSAEDAPITYLAEPNVYVLQNASVILSAAPHKANAMIAQIAMDEGVPYCDLGGSHDMAAVQKMRARMQNIRTPVVSGVGASPGSVSVIGADFAERLGCKHIEAYCGGLPYPKPDPKQNPLMYKCTWSPEGLAHEYCGKTLVLRGGDQEVRCHQVRALSEVVPFTLKWGCCGEETFEAMWTSNNSHYSVNYLRHLGVQKFDYRTLRYPGHVAALERCVRRKQNGLFDEKCMLAVLKSTPELVFDRERDSDWMPHVVRGAHEQGGPWTHEYCFITHKDPLTGFTAMELSTSWGAAIGAYALASGRWKPEGFALPEMCGERLWYRGELERRLRLYNMHDPQMRCA